MDSNIKINIKKKTNKQTFEINDKQQRTVTVTQSSLRLG